MFADLCASVWALSALRVAAETDLLATLAAGTRDASSLARASGLDPEATSRILDVLAANDVVARDGDGYVLTEEGAQLAARGQGLRADLAVTFGATRALVEEARRGSLAPGWRHVDPEVIRAQGGLSSEMIHRVVGPMMAGRPELAKLLGRDDARHADVGVGSAGGAIALASHFPKLRITGIDPLRAAHIEARAAVAAAGLSHRIELRLQRVEDMNDERVFHTAFIASKFFDRPALVAAFDRLRRALVPGGAIFLGAWRDPGDAKKASVSRLREHLHGGTAMETDEMKQLLDRAGFVDVREGPPRGDIQPLLAFVPA
jgi:hypothetical protein